MLIMEEKKNTPEFIKPQYFWDVDVENLHLQESERLIIERIFSLGTLDDIKSVIRFYGKEDVINTLMKINYLDPKTLNFVSKMFNKPKTQFKCYTRMQSKSPHWNS
ncbi:MAG: hypothetical protein K9G67_06110 [Bacteroidales bacterium]|nr:hypothetical protein [Bacteroidales bacterium]MCF8343047.1 hypothetical protein [Bacteroidales bacterium]MCF8375910.1 hypothetical protein [Bacteroidales bacterium]